MILKLTEPINNFVLYGHTEIFAWLSEILAATEDRIEYRPHFFPTDVTVRLPDGITYTVIFCGMINDSGRDIVMDTLRQIPAEDRVMAAVDTIEIDELERKLYIAF